MGVHCSSGSASSTSAAYTTSDIVTASTSFTSKPYTMSVDTSAPIFASIHQGNNTSQFHLRYEMDQEGDDCLDDVKSRPQGRCKVSLALPHLQGCDTFKEIGNILVVRDLLLILREDQILFNFPAGENFERIVWAILFVIYFIENGVGAVAIFFL